jgi:hypothetical protein
MFMRESNPDNFCIYTALMLTAIYEVQFQSPYMFRL